MVQRRGAAVEIAGLRREYVSGQGTVVAIDHVDLSVAPGEFVCFVGPSGCGKSTLLRILAGLDKQTAGTIKVDAAGWAVENAMVFQDSGLFPWMSVEKNVRFSNRPVGVKRFQTIHHCSVDVARGLALLSGIGTEALPLWDSRIGGTI